MTHRDTLETMSRQVAGLWPDQKKALAWTLAEIDRLTAEVAAAEARGEQRGREALSQGCATCGCRGVGHRAGVRYDKCLEHSLPCEDLGGSCGKWTPLTEPQKEDTSGTK